MEEDLCPTLPPQHKDITPRHGVVILESWKDKYEVWSQPTKDRGVERAQDPDGTVKQLSQLRRLPIPPEFWPFDKGNFYWSEAS